MRRKLLSCKGVFAATILLVSALGQAALASDITIDFNGLPGDDGSPFTNYLEYGFTVSALTNNWLVGKGYGNPIPFIYFVAQPNEMVDGTISVTEGGAQFNFDSIDLYSSITTIPYTFTGFLNNNQVFSVSGTVPNTFGNFATVDNPDSNLLIDTLEVTLTNGTPCCENPMGLDNIVVTQAGSVPEPASLTLLVTGLASLGALRHRLFGASGKRHP